MDAVTARWTLGSSRTLRLMIQGTPGAGCEAVMIPRPIKRRTVMVHTPSRVAASFERELLGAGLGVVCGQLVVAAV